MARVDELGIRRETTQRADHAFTPGQMRAAGIGSELTLTRELGNDQRAEDAQHELQHQDHQELHATAALA
jgi:hypothetical protein